MKNRFFFWFKYTKKDEKVCTVCCEKNKKMREVSLEIYL